jgi:hypothetical protein
MCHLALPSKMAYALPRERPERKSNPIIASLRLHELSALQSCEGRVQLASFAGCCSVARQVYYWADDGERELNNPGRNTP